MELTRLRRSAAVIVFVAAACTPTNNSNARGTLGPALSQQGWALCASGLASASWRKSGVMLGISESSLAPGDYPRITQFIRVISPCS